MLKRMSLKKILVCSLALFSLTIINFIPSHDLNASKEVKYIDDNKKTGTVFLENKNSLLTKVNVEIKSDDIEKKAKELIEDLIVNNDDIPNGFKGVIPQGTKINSIKFNNETIKIDFNEEILKTDDEDKVIEAIIYTLTSIDSVNYVVIYINGEILTQLPKTKRTLPNILDRSYGINKDYKITSDKDITSTTIYYVDTYKDQEYYVPVTKINNDTREKVEIIVEELSNTVQKKLMSYLNSNTKLLSSNIDNNNLSLVFNEYIFNDQDEQDILKEVIETICLSIGDNYNVDSVSFNVGKKEINKTTLKSLE